MIETIAPTYKERPTSVRTARFLVDGTIEHYEPPEYHGSPVDPRGSLVTFRWGYDLPELVAAWAPFDVRVLRFHDRHHGIIGEFTEVYVCEKRREHADPDSRVSKVSPGKRDLPT